jgi:hypothetical protein
MGSAVRSEGSAEQARRSPAVRRDACERSGGAMGEVAGWMGEVAGCDGRGRAAAAYPAEWRGWAAAG